MVVLGGGRPLFILAPHLEGLKGKNLNNKFLFFNFLTPFSSFLLFPVPFFKFRRQVPFAPEYAPGGPAKFINVYSILVYLCSIPLKRLKAGFNFLICKIFEFSVAFDNPLESLRVAKFQNIKSFKSIQ